jgi:hypothetical protein
MFNETSIFLHFVETGRKTESTEKVASKQASEERKKETNKKAKKQTKRRNEGTHNAFLRLQNISVPR